MFKRKNAPVKDNAQTAVVDAPKEIDTRPILAFDFMDTLTYFEDPSDRYQRVHPRAKAFIESWEQRGFRVIIVTGGEINDLLQGLGYEPDDKGRHEDVYMSNRSGKRSALELAASHPDQAIVYIGDDHNDLKSALFDDHIETKLTKKIRAIMFANTAPSPTIAALNERGFEYIKNMFPDNQVVMVTGFDDLEIAIKQIFIDLGVQFQEQEDQTPKDKYVFTGFTKSDDASLFALIYKEQLGVHLDESLSSQCSVVVENDESYKTPFQIVIEVPTGTSYNSLLSAGKATMDIFRPVFMIDSGRISANPRRIE